MKNVAQAMADSVIKPTTRNGSKYRNLQNKILAFVAGSSTAVTTGTLAKSFNSNIASINTRLAELSAMGVSFKTFAVNVNGTRQVAYSL